MEAIWFWVLAPLLIVLVIFAWYWWKNPNKIYGTTTNFFKSFSKTNIGKKEKREPPETFKPLIRDRR